MDSLLQKPFTIFLFTLCLSGIAFAETPPEELQEVYVQSGPIPQGRLRCCRRPCRPFIYNPSYDYHYPYQYRSQRYPWEFDRHPRWWREDDGIPY